MKGQVSDTAGYGDPAACAVGGRGAFRVDQGRRAEYTGLTWNFFLATKYCMRLMTLMVARWCSRSLQWRMGRRA